MGVLTTNVLGAGGGAGRGENAGDVRTDGELVPQAALSVVVVPGRMSLRMKNSAKRKLLSWKVSCGYGAVV